MTDQQPRPPLWRVIDCAFRDETLSPDPEPVHQVFMDGYAAEIRAVATYIETHGLINTISQPTPRSGPRLLALLEEEAKRAEAGEQ